MELKDVLGELVNFIRSAAPIMWEAAYRQVWLEGIVELVLGFLGLLLAGTSFWFAKFLYNKEENTPRRQYQETADHFGSMWPIMGGGFLVVVVVILLVAGVLRCANPTWYAINKLLELAH